MAHILHLYFPLRESSSWYFFIYLLALYFQVDMLDVVLWGSLYLYLLDYS